MDNVPLDKIVLNKSQKKAKLHIMRGKNVFVTGGAGSGKSILIKAVVEELERTGKRTILCAPTGMAALKIGGTTIHRAFGFPVGPCIVQEKNGAGLSVMTNVSAMLKLADLVLVDEVSLIRADIFDAMVLSIKKAETLTGRRIQLVVIGDFFQLPPVLPRDSIERTLLEAYYGHDIGYAYAFQSHYWDSCRFLTITLDEPMRQKDPKLIDCLNLQNSTF